MTVRFLLDSNIISEPSRPIPNTQVLDQLNRYRSEVAVASLIASIAFCNDLILVTNNMADFQDFEDLIIENWFITVD